MVGNALLGILPAGLASERVFDGVFPHELDQVTGPVRIFGFYPEEQDLEFRSMIERSLKGLSAKVDLPDPVFSSLVNKNWAAAWQERYQPIPLGKKLIVVPSWLENPDPERIPIYIDPGMAFGSGVHETTQLSMVLLESCLIDQHQQRGDRCRLRIRNPVHCSCKIRREQNIGRGFGLRSHSCIRRECH